MRKNEETMETAFVQALVEILIGSLLIGAFGHAFLEFMRNDIPRWVPYAIACIFMTAQKIADLVSIFVNGLF